MGSSSLPEDNIQRIQKWLSPAFATNCHHLPPSPPPSDLTLRKRTFDEAFPANKVVSVLRRSEAWSISNVTDLTERSSFAVPSRGKDGSRSPSPARKLLRLLEEAEPPLRCYQHGTVELPPPALDLLKSLSRNLWKGVIPNAFKVGLL